jgi:hypothetical protein
MSAQDHRQLVGHFVEAIYNANEPDAADSFLSTEFLNRNPYPGARFRSRCVQGRLPRVS